MWSIEGTALELTYNYGTESDESFKRYYHPGNEERDGFGHIAFNTNDVYKACEDLEKAGVAFKKKPDEGRLVCGSWFMVCSMYDVLCFDILRVLLNDFIDALS